MNRVEELTLKLLDGAIDPQESAELEQLVSDDAQARGQHVALCELEAALRATAENVDVRETSMKLVRSDTTAVWVDDSDISRMERESEGFSISRFVSQLAGGRIPWLRPLPLAALAAGVLVTVTAAVFLLTRNGDAPGPGVAAVEISATIAHAEAGVLVYRAGKGIAATKDFPLRPADLLIVPGNAVAAIRYSDDSRVLLGPDSRVSIQPDDNQETLTSKKSLLLKKGRLTAHVTKQGPGHSLVIRSHNAQVTVLGTRFTLVADKTSTRLDVIEGRVAMTGAHDQRSVEVPQGMYAVASPGTELAASPIPPRVSTGLGALYRFQQSDANIVRDVSGVGEPLDLQVDGPSPVHWSDGGLSLQKPALLKSKQPARKIIQACKKSDELTVEAWVRPASTSQQGPARLVTLSKDTSERNFALGHGGAEDEDLSSNFDVRLRTTKTSNNGLPSVATPNGSVEADLTHVVYTRSRDGHARVYVDGLLHANERVAGSFSNWDDGYQLALGNELTGDRPWRGVFYLVAIYDRALNENEILQNFRAAFAR